MSQSEGKMLEVDAAVLGRVFEHIGRAIIVASTDRRILNMNLAARELFGYSNNDIVNQSTQILYADSREFDLQGQQRYNASASFDDKSYIVSYKSSSGRIFKGLTSGGPVNDAQGRNQFFVAIIKDDSSRIAAEDVLNQLHSITSSRQLSFKQRVDAILKLGTEHFGLPIGIFSQIIGNQYVVQQAIHPENALEEGMIFDLGVTYCSHVFNANDVKGFNHVSVSDIATHPCFRNFGLEAYLGAPIFVDGERFGTLNFSSPEPTRPFIHQDIAIVRLFAEWIGHEVARNNDLSALENTRKQLEYIANTDALTGLANRGCIEKTLTELIINVQHNNKPLVVAILDFDHFKSINDTYGHNAGDEVLILFGNIVKGLCRKNDFYGRWGGEEFLAIFPGSEIQGVLKLLERVMTELRHASVLSIPESTKLTLSAGVTSLKAEDNIDSILHRVDQLLYEAKNNGRDQIKYR